MNTLFHPFHYQAFSTIRRYNVYMNILMSDIKLESMTRHVNSLSKSYDELVEIDTKEDNISNITCTLLNASIS